MYEIPTTLPGPSRLEIDMWDYDRLSANDFIGKTIIDLEDRWFEQAWQDMGCVVHVNVHELRLGFSNTTRNPEGLQRHHNRVACRHTRLCCEADLLW
jgi:hypothetical protein